MANLITAPTVYTTDLTGRQSQCKDIINASGIRYYNDMLQKFNILYKFIFNNTVLNLTPQQVMDALGTNAVSVITLMEKWGVLLNAMVAGSVAAPPAYVKNADGTVTVS